MNLSLKCPYCQKKNDYVSNPVVTCAHCQREFNVTSTDCSPHSSFDLANDHVHSYGVYRHRTYRKEEWCCSRCGMIQPKQFEYRCFKRMLIALCCLFLRPERFSAETRINAEKFIHENLDLAAYTLSRISNPEDIYERKINEIAPQVQDLLDSLATRD